jgi:hypothetical protein
LDYKPLTIDMFYFKNGQAILNGNPNSDNSSSDVYGFNANYQLNDPMGTVVEGYMFSRFNQNDSTGVTVGDKEDTLFVPGLRASTNPVKGLNVQGELAWQLGQHESIPFGAPSSAQESQKREAMAAQFLATYQLPVLDKYKPTVNASYTYVSGSKYTNANYNTDHVSGAHIDTAWDPFNETQGSGTIYNTLFPLTNMHILALGATVNPMEDLTAAFTWSGLWAADAYGGPNNPLALFQPDGGNNLYFPQTKAHNTGLGNEYDINFTYNYTEDVTFGVSLGWYVPGSALSSNNSDVASQALASVGVKF